MGLDTALDTLLSNGRGVIDSTSKIYGVAPAIVTAVSDKTNAKRHLLGMIQVYFPWLQSRSDPNLINPWARVCMPNAGDVAGFYTVSQVGDEVLVGFEHGDPAFPYVLGSLWNGESKIPGPQTDEDGTECKGSHKGPPTHKTPDLVPESLAGDKGVNMEYFWRSRSGNLMILDDKGGTIRIEEKTGASVIQLEADNVKILQKSGDMNLWAKETIRFDCTDFDVHASKKILLYAKEDWGAKVDGDMTMECGKDLSAVAKAESGVNGGNGIIWQSKSDGLKVQSSLALDWVAAQNMIVKSSSGDTKITANMKLAATCAKDINVKAMSATVSGLMGVTWTAKDHLNIQAGSMIMVNAMCININ